MAAGVSFEEHRANLEQEETHEPAPREENLAWCRLALSRYGGADQLDQLPVVEGRVPICDDCHEEADILYQLGRYALCRTDAAMRLRAGARLVAPSRAIQETFLNEQRPDDLHAWALAASADHTDALIRASLRTWGIDDDLVVELVDAAADHRRTQRKSAAA